MAGGGGEIFAFFPFPGGGDSDRFRFDDGAVDAGDALLGRPGRGARGWSSSLSEIILIHTALIHCIMQKKLIFAIRNPLSSVLRLGIT